MAKTVVALYDDFSTARNAVEELVDAGFNRGDISLVANDASGTYSTQFKDGKVVTEDVTAGEGAGFGAVVGALVGLGVALIPGIGPVLAAGPLAAALFAGIGAASGAVTGGVVAGLVDFGVPEEHAERYAEGIRKGGTLVTVHVTQDEWADRAQSVLNRYHPVNINEQNGFVSSTGYDATTLQRVQTQSIGSSTTTTVAPTATAVRPYADYEQRFRTNYDVNYANSGYDYTVYDPAYHYGYTLANDPAYQGRSWSQIEPDVHAYWDTNYPGTWDRVKNSIRDSWEEVNGG